jgi:hypothetical protein
VGKRKTKAPGQCIAKGPDPDTGRIKRCPNPVRSLGLCRGCYDTAYREVEIKKATTWDALIAEGKALPSTKKPTTLRRAIRSSKRRPVSS